MNREQRRRRCSESARDSRGSRAVGAAKVPPIRSPFSPAQVREDREGGIRRHWVPIGLFAGAFVLASGTATFAYTIASGSGTGQAQAGTLPPPVPVLPRAPTTTSLALTWVASPGPLQVAGIWSCGSPRPQGRTQRSPAGRLTRRPPWCRQPTSCTDTGLTAGTPTITRYKRPTTTSDRSGQRPRLPVLGSPARSLRVRRAAGRPGTTSRSGYHQREARRASTSALRALSR